MTRRIRSCPNWKKQREQNGQNQRAIRKDKLPLVKSDFRKTGLEAVRECSPVIATVIKGLADLKRPSYPFSAGWTQGSNGKFTWSGLGFQPRTSYQMSYRFTFVNKVGWP
ncbi:hypothetical protein PoB_002949000 [Plakobranchus ocellatus]|uniref:Uncharacterized protein n=1 Tax=Plakobranchus ocellatus TaxID=259542 RepID=A0AAV4A831_9GAST|nr:hypothetical protein PoB_002949000 [Plakobranchus ocellatus]